MEHSKNGPSSASRWLYCPGSAGADAGVAGEAAALGVLIHDLCAYRLAPNLHPAPDLSELSDDELEFAIVCAKKFTEKCRENEGEGITLVEKRLLDKESPDLFGGTLDFARITESSIHVYDLKTGRLDVSAERNEQLACYLLLARQHFGPKERYYGTIVQPRLNYVATAEYRIEDLLMVESRIRECLGDASLYAGAHCVNCPLLSVCSTARDESEELLPTLRSRESDLPTGLARARRIVEFSKPFEQLVAGATEQLKSYMQEGNVVDGYKLSTRRGRRKIGKPAQFQNWIRDNWKSWKNTGLVDGVTIEGFLYNPPVLKTPAQIEKRLPESIPAYFIDYGEESVALLSDKKIDRAEVFSGLEEFDTIDE